MEEFTNWISTVQKFENCSIWRKYIEILSGEKDTDQELLELLPQIEKTNFECVEEIISTNDKIDSSKFKGTAFINLFRKVLSKIYVDRLPQIEDPSLIKPIIEYLKHNLEIECKEFDKNYLICNSNLDEESLKTLFSILPNRKRDTKIYLDYSINLFENTQDNSIRIILLETWEESNYIYLETSSELFENILNIALRYLNKYGILQKLNTLEKSKESEDLVRKMEEIFNSAQEITSEMLSDPTNEELTKRKFSELAVLVIPSQELEDLLKNFEEKGEKIDIPSIVNGKIKEMETKVSTTLAKEKLESSTEKLGERLFMAAIGFFDEVVRKIETNADSEVDRNEKMNEIYIRLKPTLIRKVLKLLKVEMKYYPQENPHKYHGLYGILCTVMGYETDQEEFGLIVSVIENNITSNDEPSRIYGTLLIGCFDKCDFLGVRDHCETFLNSKDFICQTILNYQITDRNFVIVLKILRKLANNANLFQFADWQQIFDVIEPKLIQLSKETDLDENCSALISTFFCHRSQNLALDDFVIEYATQFKIIEGVTDWHNRAARKFRVFLKTIFDTTEFRTISDQFSQFCCKELEKYFDHQLSQKEVRSMNTLLSTVNSFTRSNPDKALNFYPFIVQMSEAKLNFRNEIPEDEIIGIVFLEFFDILEKITENEDISYETENQIIKDTIESHASYPQICRQGYSALFAIHGKKTKYESFHAALEVLKNPKLEAYWGVAFTNISHMYYMFRGPLEDEILTQLFFPSCLVAGFGASLFKNKSLDFYESLVKYAALYFNQAQIQPFINVHIELILSFEYRFFSRRFLGTLIGLQNSGIQYEESQIQRITQFKERFQ